MKTINPATLPNINSQVATLKQRMIDSIKREAKWLKERFQENVANLERNRQAAADLHAAGFDLQQSEWDDACESIYIDLGEAHVGRGSRKRIEQAKVAIAKLLQCHLEPQGTELVEGQEKKRVVKVTLRPAKFSKITIQYKDRLPRMPGTTRCHVVREVEKAKRKVSYRLECKC